MQITIPKLAALVAGTVALTAGLTAFITPVAAPSPAPAPLPQIVIKKMTIACGTRENLDAIGTIASGGNLELFNQAVEYAASTGKCQELQPGQQITIVSEAAGYSDVLTADGRRMLAFSSTLGEAE